MMAGPCSVESREQLFETADAVKAAGATILRGGAFKPRTSPYAFQGLGVEGLRYLAEARERTGLPVITEVMEPNQVDIVAEYADILQIGTRNMQNYSLLRDVGRVARPVMLKRGYGATIEEWLMAAEYIVSSGNPNVILCERGIRTFETYTRNTLDLAAVPLLHHLTHLPVIVDPSHATGKRWLVKPLAIGGVAVGADGVMVEVHPAPGRGAVRRRAAARPRPVPRHDGRHRRRSTPGRVRGAVSPSPPGRGRRRAVEALTRHDRARTRRRPSSAPRARLRGDLRAARRQVDQPSRAAPGRRSPPARAGSSGAGDGADVRSTAGIVRGARGDRRAASAATAGRSTTGSSRRAPTASASPAAILDCGNSGTSLRLIARRARGPAADGTPRRRRFVARPPGGSYHRTAALDGRRAPRPAERLPPSPDRGRSHPAPGHRLRRRRCRARR